MAEKGWGQPQSYQEALTWYYKAAEQGSDTAQENIGYMFQYGTGVPIDYDKALAWYYQAADQGNGDALNQLGWMYQYGQGVKQDDAEALGWYQLSANQGNLHGKINLEAFTDDLKYRRGGVLENAINAKVNDPAFLRAQRGADIRDLRARITGLESDAVNQDDLADQLEHMGHGKNDAISKAFNAMGSVGAVKFHIEATKYRAEAARLRDQLAQIESQNQSGVGPVLP
jgi:TPR repeat protein